MARTGKLVRLDDRELEALNNLILHNPRVKTEAQMLYEVAYLGLLAKAAKATVPGAPPYAGFDPDVLAALLEDELRAVVLFLKQRGKLADMFTAPALPSPSPAEMPTQQADSAAAPLIAIRDDAADDQEALGATFLDG
jgi:hypothetical protein